MKSNIIARVALVSSFALAAALPLRAQAPSTTTFVFTPGNNMTITGSKLVPVSVLVADTTGLKYVTLSGAGRSSSMICSGAASASLSLLWNTTYIAAGDYKFTSTAFNGAGQSVSSTTMVHLVK